MPHIERCSGHHRVDGVPEGALEVVSHHPVVRFQVADNRFDACTLAELLAGLLFLVVALSRGAGGRNTDFCTSNPFLSTISTVCHMPLSACNQSNALLAPDVQATCDHHTGCPGTPVYLQSIRCMSSLLRSCSRTRTSCVPSPSRCTPPLAHEGCTPSPCRCAPI